MMKIGIIGAGHIGGTLTRRLSALGHDVAVANSRGPDTLADLAAETGATAVTARNATRRRDVVIVAIPEAAVPDLPDELFESVADDVAIVDTGNYYPQRDGRIPAIEEGVPESRWVSQQLGRPVVKAFNTIRAGDLAALGRPAGTPDRIGLPVAGDEAEQKQLVMRLVEDLGFDAVDAGELDDSWRQQPGTPVYAANLNAVGVRHALAQVKPGRPAGFRA